MAVPAPESDHTVWSRLWRTGALHSCIEDFQGNYDGQTAAFWRSQFDRLADGARVLDVGTGNGAVALLACEAARARGVAFEVHAADAAEIDPPSAAGRDYAGIRFHPRTPTEALPFEAGSIDLVTAQFAFEYAPQAAALAELLRVTGPRGHVAMIVHARGSAILQTTQAQLAACRALFEDDDFFAATRRMVEVLGNAPTPAQRAALATDPRAESVRLAFNGAAGRVLDQAQALGAPDLIKRAVEVASTALRQVDQQGGLATLAWLDAREADLRDHWLRLRQLDAVALDEAQVAALCVAAGAAGRQARWRAHHYDAGPQMGWIVEIGHG